MFGNANSSVMIEKLFNRHYPFAFCISTAWTMDGECSDPYIVVPKPTKHEMGIKFKGYYSITTVSCDRRDREWFIKHQDYFNLVKQNEHGRVYEPKYCNFRDDMKIRQKAFEF